MLFSLVAMPDFAGLADAVYYDFDAPRVPFSGTNLGRKAADFYPDFACK
jgi:hypothetical protein